MALALYRTILCWTLRVVGGLAIALAIWDIVDTQMLAPHLPRSADEVVYSYINSLGGGLLMLGVAEAIAVKRQ